MGIPVVPILCALLLIGGIIALVISGANWRWYHITLVALILLVALGWIVLTSRTLAIQQSWRSEVTAWEKRLKEAEKQHDQLVDGYTDADGKEHPLQIDTLKIEVAKMLEGRGRKWQQFARRSVDPATGQIVATQIAEQDAEGKTKQPSPHGIEPKTILWAFAGRVDPKNPQMVNIAQFLGQFEVAAVNGLEVRLQPVLKLRPKEIAKIAASPAGNIVLYEVMPTDSHEAYAEFQNDPNFLEKFSNEIPDSVKQEFAKDNKPAAAQEPNPRCVWQRVKVIKEFDVPGTRGDQAEKEKVTEGTVLLLDQKSAQEQIAAGNVEAVPGEERIYVRSLRDYGRLYRALNLEIEDLLRKISDIDHQSAAVKESLVKVERDTTYRKEEIAALNRDLVHYRAENKLIKDHVASLEKRITEVRGELDRVLADNRSKVAELSQSVHAAADEIGQRARPVASNSIP